MFWEPIIAVGHHYSLLHFPNNSCGSFKLAGGNDVGEGGTEQNDCRQEYEYMGDVKSPQERLHRMVNVVKVLKISDMPPSKMLSPC